jgi:hypothetical protein
MRIAVLLLAALALAGCCGRGVWYSSPSSRCDLAAASAHA